jgi:thiol:disulfide interchange protein
MMAAAVWMTSVLASLTGPEGAVTLLAAMLAAGLGAWVWGRWGTLSRSPRVRVTAGALAVALVIGSTAAAAASLPGAGLAVAAQSDSAPPGAWQPWSAARVEELRSAGRPVFVDFTAKWCLTCAVNERVALGNSAVRARFAGAGIATLRADWTDANDEITRALAGFGRAGVPLYVYYPRGGKDPVVLPEVLTPGIVLAALAAD